MTSGRSDTMNHSSTPSLKLSLFGTMRMEVQGTTVAGKCARKEMWLLALLALRLGKPVQREYLSGLLWPDTSEEQALYYLRRCLSNLRSALGQSGDCLQVIKPRSLCLDSSTVWVDVCEFDRLIGRDDPVALEQAIALRSATFLEDCTDDWAFQERNAREIAYHTALNRLAELSVQRLAWSEVARYARLLIASDPLEEKASRTLMLALARNNNHGAAMQVYRDLRLRLREDINADPDPETVGLYETLRQEARQASASPQRSASPVVSALEAKPAVAPAAPMQRLPQSLTRLIGRDFEREELLSYLSHSRLVTLTGTGGIGKTSLSLEVARHAASRFAQGVCFVELAPVTDPTRLPNLLAQTLQLREEPGVPIQDTLTQTLAQQEMLLVLDNCEHLLHASAQLVHHLLAYCPRLRILASSRQSLGLPGETIWRVPSLPTPPEMKTLALPIDAKVDSSVVLEYPSVQLFLERVRQSDPDFRLTPQSLALVGQICRQLDGIPLALELAAGRARVLPLAHIAARLDDRLRLLVGGSRAALPRQQTLRALMDWSYDLLTETERTQLRYLSVFANGWTLEAAEAVCCKGEEDQQPHAVPAGTSGRHNSPVETSGVLPSALPASEPVEPWELLDLLMALVEKSLVIYEKTEDGARYRMLETVRQFAQEKLRQAGEEEPLRKRGCDYYYHFLMEWKNTLYGKHQIKTLSLFDQEKDNLDRALEFATHHEPYREKALEMATILQHYWRIRGDISAGRQKLRALLEAAPVPTLARAAALNAVCTLAYFQGDYEEAWSYGNEGLAIYRDLNNSPGIASTLGNCANVANYLGHYETAKRLNEEALVLYKQLQNKRSIAITLNGLGAVMLHLGEIHEAETYFRESLTLRRELEDTLGIGITLTNLADIMLLRNDLDATEKLIAESEIIYQVISEKRGLATLCQSRGNIAVRRGEYQQAMDHYRDALALFRTIGDKRGYLSFLDVIVKLDLKQGEYERAARLNGALQALRQRIRYVLPPVAIQEVAEIRQRLEAHLGTETHSALSQEGQALSMEAALELAERPSRSF